MTSFVLMGLLLLQLEKGAVEGIVRDLSGKPQSGVRVGAMPASDKNAETDVLVSNARTDENGHYRLEVPPGRYDVIAGRIECPIYYSGARERSGATSIEVAAGKTNTAVDFVGPAESLYPPSGILSNLLSCNEREWPPILRAFLVGSAHPLGGATLIFSLDGVTGSTVSFKTDSGPLNYDCPGCSFLVTDSNAAPRSAETGILFRRSADGQNLDFTCQARFCDVITAPSTGVAEPFRLRKGETGTVRISDQSAFSVIP